MNDDDEGCRFHIPYSPLPSSRTNEGTNEQTKRSAVRWGAAGDRYSRGSKFFKSLATDYTFPLADPNNNNNKKISSRTQKKKKKKRASTAVCSFRHFPHAASLQKKQTNERTSNCRLLFKSAYKLILHLNDSLVSHHTHVPIIPTSFNHKSFVIVQLLLQISISSRLFCFPVERRRR